MAFLARSRKNDLITLAAELGVEQPSNPRIAQLCKLIMEHDDYEEELVKNMLTAVVADRESKEARDLEKQREEFELTKDREMREFELAKLRLETEAKLRLETEANGAIINDYPNDESEDYPKYEYPTSHNERNEQANVRCLKIVKRHPKTEAHVRCLKIARYLPKVNTEKNSRETYIDQQKRSSYPDIWQAPIDLSIKESDTRRSNPEEAKRNEEPLRNRIDAKKSISVTDQASEYHGKKKTERSVQVAKMFDETSQATSEEATDTFPIERRAVAARIAEPPYPDIRNEDDVEQLQNTRIKNALNNVVYNYKLNKIEDNPEVLKSTTKLLNGRNKKSCDDVQHIEDQPGVKNTHLGKMVQANDAIRNSKEDENNFKSSCEQIIDENNAITLEYKEALTKYFKDEKDRQILDIEEKYKIENSKLQEILLKHEKELNTCKEIIEKAVMKYNETNKEVAAKITDLEKKYSQELEDEESLPDVNIGCTDEFKEDKQFKRELTSDDKHSVEEDNIKDDQQSNDDEELEDFNEKEIGADKRSKEGPVKLKKDKRRTEVMHDSIYKDEKDEKQKKGELEKVEDVPDPPKHKKPVKKKKKRRKSCRDRVQVSPQMKSDTLDI